MTTKPLLNQPPRHETENDTRRRHRETLQTHAWCNEFGCPDYPYCEEVNLGYLRLPAVFARSHVVRAFSCANPSRMKKHWAFWGVLGGLEATNSFSSKATDCGLLLLCSEYIPPSDVERRSGAPKTIVLHDLPLLLSAPCMRVLTSADTRKCCFLGARVAVPVRQTLNRSLLCFLATVQATSRQPFP